MISQPLQHPVVIALAAAALHATVYYYKNTRRTGEDFDAIRWLVTVAFGGVVGLGAYLVGFQPPTELYFFLFMAYVGMISELEAALKAVMAGRYDDAQARLRDALTAGSDATEDVVGDSTERAIEDKLNSQLPEDKRVSSDAWDNAQDRESMDEFIERILEAKQEEGQGLRAKEKGEQETEVVETEKGRQVLRGP